LIGSSALASMAGGGATGGMAGGMFGGMAGGPQGDQQPQMMMRMGGEGGGQGGQGGDASATGEGRQRRAGGRSGAMLSGLSEEDRAKVQAEMQKVLKGRSMQDLSPEERTALFTKIRELVPNAGRRSGQGGADAGGRGGSGSETAGGSGRRRNGGDGGDAGTAGGGRQGANGGAPGGMSFGFASPGGAGRRWTKEQLDAAKMPPPPEEDEALDVLLRPGLLADIEIIVERIPNALHIPSQAVFEKEGKPIVFVKVGERFEERSIKIARQSESTTIIASGLKANDVVSLVNPEAKPGDKKGAADKGGAGNPSKGMGGKGGQ